MSNFFWRLCTATTVTAATAILVSELAIVPDDGGDGRRAARKHVARKDRTETAPAPRGDAGRTAARSRRNASH